MRHCEHWLDLVPLCLTVTPLDILPAAEFEAGMGEYVSCKKCIAALPKLHAAVEEAERVANFRRVAEAADLARLNKAYRRKYPMHMQKLDSER